MHHPNLATFRSPTAYRCPVCTRCFVSLDKLHAREVLCVCGAALQPSSLPHGMYELRSPEPYDGPVTEPKQCASSSPTPVEPDLGYGESHGYGPAHGGPTGPGDAPAGESAERS